MSPPDPGSWHVKATELSAHLGQESSSSQVRAALGHVTSGLLANSTAHSAAAGAALIGVDLALDELPGPYADTEMCDDESIGIEDVRPLLQAAADALAGAGPRGEDRLARARAASFLRRALAAISGVGSG